jgi:hypothetical protein
MDCHSELKKCPRVNNKEPRVSTSRRNNLERGGQAARLRNSNRLTLGFIAPQDLRIEIRKGFDIFSGK